LKHYLSKYTFHLLYLLCVACSGSLYASPKDTIKDTELHLNLQIDSMVATLVDSSDTLTIKDLLKNKNKENFTNNAARQPYWLNNVHAAHWFAFQMENSTKKPMELVIELDNARLDSVTLYLAHKDTIIEQKVSGKMIPPLLWDIRFRNPAFELEIPPGKSRQIYIKIKSTTPVRIPLKVYTREDFHVYKDRTNLIFTLFYGILFILVLHNLFLFISTRDFTYLMFLLFNAVLGLLLMNLNGFPFQYAELTRLKFFDLTPIFMLMAYLFLLFTIGYLRLRRSGKVLFYGFSATAILFPLLLLVLRAISFPTYRIQAQLLLALLVILFAGAIYALQRHRYRPAWHYLSGIWILLLGISFYLLALRGKFPVNFWMEYALQVGIILAAALISMGLSERQKIIDKEKQAGRARATYISEVMEFLKELHMIPEDENKP
jgi:hypothetical protein